MGKKHIQARNQLGTSPVATGGFGGLSPPKQSSKPPHIEI